MLIKINGGNIVKPKNKKLAPITKNMTAIKTRPKTDGKAIMEQVS